MKNGLRGLTRAMGRGIKRKAPEILVGLGIGGMATTTVLAVSATPKAIKLLEKAKEEKGEKLTVKETVKTAWRCYVPAGISFATSIVCLASANSVHNKRNAALATAYKISEAAMAEYRVKTAEVIGDEKEEEIHNIIVKDQIDKNPPKGEVVVVSEGYDICYDLVFGRYFKGNQTSIDRAVAALNRMIVRYGYASLNDFYDELEISNIKIGDDLGWTTDDGEIFIKRSSVLGDDGHAYLAIECSVAPHYNYAMFS